MDDLAVQCGHGPDVGGVGESVTVDALQLQKQIVSAGIPVADGLAVMKQAVGQVADGGVVPGVIVGAVGGDPLVIGPGDLPLGGGGGNGPLLPQRVMDGNGGRQRFRPVFLGTVAGDGAEFQDHGPGGVIGAGGVVIALLAVPLDRQQGIVQSFLSAGNGKALIVFQGQGVFPLREHIADGLVIVRRSLWGGYVGPRRDQILVGGPLGAVKLRQVPVRRQPKGGIHHPGQHGRGGPSGDGRIRQKGAGFVAAHADPAAVKLEDIIIIRRVFRHVGDPAAAGVGLSDEGIVDRGQYCFRQEICQHMGHLGSGSHIGELLVQSLV